MLNKSLLNFHQVFKNLQLFLENKQPEDDLFDRLNVRNTHMNIWRRGFSLRELFTFLVVILVSLCFPFPSQLYPLLLLGVSCRLLFWISTYRSWWMAWQPRSFVPTTPPSPCSSSSRNSPAVSNCSFSQSHTARMNDTQILCKHS